MPSTATPPPPTMPLSPQVPSTRAPRAAAAGHRSPLLHRLTSLTTIAAAAAAGLMALGVMSLVGGHYTKQVVHDQLAPQHIFFPKKGDPGLFKDLQKYAGQQVVNGDQAKAYADKFINRHLAKIGGGKTYSEVSAASIADPKNQALITQKQTLFQGETLRGLLLSGWGWSIVGTVATLAGYLLLILGGLLFLLPLANWQVNLRGRPGTVA